MIDENKKTDRRGFLKGLLAGGALGVAARHLAPMAVQETDGLLNNPELLNPQNRGMTRRDGLEFAKAEGTRNRYILRIFDNAAGQDIKNVTLSNRQVIIGYHSDREDRVINLPNDQQFEDTTPALSASFEITNYILGKEVKIQPVVENEGNELYIEAKRSRAGTTFHFNLAKKTAGKLVISNDHFNEGGKAECIVSGLNEQHVREIAEVQRQRILDEHEDKHAIKFTDGTIIQARDSSVRLQDLKGRYYDGVADDRKPKEEARRR